MCDSKRTVRQWDGRRVRQPHRRERPNLRLSQHRRSWRHAYGGRRRTERRELGVFGVGCDPGQASYYECPGSNSAGFEAQALVSSGSFTLLDSTVPAVTNVSGSLIAGGTLTGTETISFKASDSGGGMYSATVLVDGHQVEQKVPNTNGGLCANLAPGSSPTMTFAAPQPCPATENVSMSLNTTKLSAGQHQLQVVVTDAAGDEAPAYEGTITVGGSPARAGALREALPVVPRGLHRGLWWHEHPDRLGWPAPVRRPGQPGRVARPGERHERLGSGHADRALGSTPKGSRTSRYGVARPHHGASERARRPADLGRLDRRVSRRPPIRAPRHASAPRGYARDPPAHGR